MSIGINLGTDQIWDEGKTKEEIWYNLINLSKKDYDWIVEKIEDKRINDSRKAFQELRDGFLKKKKK